MTFDTAQCTQHSVGTANELFAALVQTILVAQCNISLSNQWPKDHGDNIREGTKIRTKSSYSITFFFT